MYEFLADPVWGEGGLCAHGAEPEQDSVDDFAADAAAAELVRDALRRPPLHAPPLASVVPRVCLVRQRAPRLHHGGGEVTAGGHAHGPLEGRVGACARGRQEPSILNVGAPAFMLDWGRIASRWGARGPRKHTHQVGMPLRCGALQVSVRDKGLMGRPGG